MNIRYSYSPSALSSTNGFFRTVLAILALVTSCGAAHADSLEMVPNHYVTLAVEVADAKDPSGVTFRDTGTRDRIFTWSY